ncbi:MAG: hydroxyacid dehydrogenase [bacterium]|jgi:D-3-phosphoglycerate dehydrogenase
MAKPKVLFIQPIHEDGMDRMAQVAEIIMAERVDEDYVAKAAADVDAIIVRVSPITEKIIKAAKNLKVIGRHGVGYDNIDIAAATAAGVPVVYAPGTNTNAVAEQAIALMFALAKHLVPAHEALKQNGDYGYRLRVRSCELKGKTLGLVGLGNIGRRVAAFCQLGFGMKVVGTDPFLNEEAIKAAGLEIEVTDLDGVLQAADFVSLHAPAKPDTYKIIGKRELKLMKKTAYLINTARGPLVDEAALLEALQEGEIAGAGLDVFDPEPPQGDNPIFQLPNVVVTPHMAAHSNESLSVMALTVVENVIQVLNGERPKDFVNPEVWE